MTLRARAGLVSLRSKRVFRTLRDCFRASSSAVFRVVQFSVQADHVHLLVEAEDRAALSSGARGLVIRSALAINRVCQRSGGLWADRYHARELGTPREVRNALVYVLMNHKKHGLADRGNIDPCSSAPWFDGFRVPLAATTDPPVTSVPRTWLATVGWRRRGLIDPTESPKTPL